MITSAIIFALVLGAFIFCILPRAGRARRTLSVGLFMALIAAVYGGGVELLGRPKPLRLEWRHAADTQLVSALPVENEGIYVWLTTPDSPEPRAYALPWSVQLAQQLQTAMSDAEARGAAVEMAMPVDGDFDGRKPMFYAKPQPALSPKNYQGAEPVIYRQPDNAS
jgi:hypothetical protein